MKTNLLRCLLGLLLLTGVTMPVVAQDLGVVRARMEQRIATIDTLKSRGVLGENNRGLLEVVSGGDEGVVAAENADRAVVYAAIAQKTGTTAEAVGKARAKQIAAASASGVWVQAENGQWVKKP